MSVEGGPMSSMGYILKPRSNATCAALWAEFDDEKPFFFYFSNFEIIYCNLTKFN